MPITKFLLFAHKLGLWPPEVWVAGWGQWAPRERALQPCTWKPLPILKKVPFKGDEDQLNKVHNEYTWAKFSKNGKEPYEHKRSWREANDWEGMQLISKPSKKDASIYAPFFYKILVNCFSS